MLFLFLKRKTRTSLKATVQYVHGLIYPKCIKDASLITKISVKGKEKGTRHFLSYWFLTKNRNMYQWSDWECNKWIDQSIVNKKEMKWPKGKWLSFSSTKSEVSCDSETENRKQCSLTDNEVTDKKFDETFLQMKWDIETPIPTEKIVSNIKTILKLESKISAIKGCLDCEMSAHNDKTNTPSASTDLALKAIQEKQKKLFRN